MTPSARPLGFVALLALGINGIVGVGIFFAPTDIAALAPGTRSVAVFAATAFAMAPVALTFAALARRFDEDGGPVLFARTAFGSGAAFAVGWLTYLSSIFSTSAIVSGLTAATLGPYGSAHETVRTGVGILVAVALSALCGAGLRIASNAWTLLTVLKLAPLIALAVAFLISRPSVSTSAPTGDGPRAVDWARAALTATFAYQGFEIVPLVSGQAVRARETVPVAVVASLTLSALLYVVLQTACVRGVPGLAREPEPLAAAAFAYGGPALRSIVRAGASVSGLGIAVGMIAMTPRYLAAVAAGAKRTFGLGETHSSGVPRRAFLWSSLALVAVLALGSRAELFVLSSLAVVLQYAAVALALLVLRWKGRIPFTRLEQSAAVGALGLAACLLGAPSYREWLIASGALVGGAVLFMVPFRPVETRNRR